MWRLTGADPRGPHLAPSLPTIFGRKNNFLNIYHLLSKILIDCIFNQLLSVAELFQSLKLYFN